MGSFTRERSRQKCILFFLGILVILGLILVKSTTIAAAELDYTFTYDDTLDGYLITGYTGTDTKPQLPDTYNRKTVVGVGESAFSGNSTIVEIDIPDSYVVLQSYAFKKCENLEKLTIGASVTDVMYDAFSGSTNFKTLIIDSSDVTFYEYSLTTVTMGEAVETISDYAFSGCSSIEEIVLGSEVTVLGDMVFDGCTSLKSLTVNSAYAVGSFCFGDVALDTLIIGDDATELPSNCPDAKEVIIGACITEIVEGKDTIIDGIFGATGDEAQKKVTIVAPQDSLAAEAALASNFRCTDSTEVSIQCRTIPMYVTETRIMELYNDDGSAKWATTDESILSVDEYGFITANAVGNATITVNVNGKTYSYDFKVIERTTENVLSVIFKYYVTEDMTDYEKVLAANRWIGDNAVYDHNEECDSRYNMNGILYELEESGIT